MSCNPVIRAYCQQVGKTLELPRIYKRRLLNGLELELEERFSSEVELTLETLYRDIGSPEESASALMECVDKKELKKYHSQQRLLTMLLIIFLLVFVVVVIIYSAYIAQYSVDHTEIRIVQYDTE